MNCCPRPPRSGGPGGRAAQPDPGRAPHDRRARGAAPGPGGSRLTGLRSARTRRAYAGDLAAWLGWLAARDTGALAAGRVHVDLWAATWLDAGAAASSVRRRLSALSSFYRYCATHDLTGWIPTQGVARPTVDPDYTATIDLDRDQARALVAAADADTQALRTAAVVRLLLHNALRVDEACAADLADLGEDSGHRVLRVVRKGARKAKIPLTPATMAALEAYLTGRAQQAGIASWRQLEGPLLATASSSRLRQGHLWELVRRLARTAGIGAWEQLSPHSLRHSAITFALDARRCPARRAGLRRPQGPPHHPPLPTTPATAWTATPLTSLPPTWRDSLALVEFVHEVEGLGLAYHELARRAGLDAPVLSFLDQRFLRVGFPSSAALCCQCGKHHGELERCSGEVVHRSCAVPAGGLLQVASLGDEPAW